MWAYGPSTAALLMRPGVGPAGRAPISGGAQTGRPHSRPCTVNAVDTEAARRNAPVNEPSASRPPTQGKSPVRTSRAPGSVQGAARNGRSLPRFRQTGPVRPASARCAAAERRRRARPTSCTPSGRPSAPVQQRQAECWHAGEGPQRAERGVAGGCQAGGAVPAVAGVSTASKLANSASRLVEQRAAPGPAPSGSRARATSRPRSNCSRSEADSWSRPCSHSRVEAGRHLGLHDRAVPVPGVGHRIGQRAASSHCAPSEPAACRRPRGSSGVGAVPDRCLDEGDARRARRLAVQRLTQGMAAARAGVGVGLRRRRPAARRAARCRRGARANTPTAVERARLRQHAACAGSARGWA